MERKELEAAAAQVTYLRGLLAIPIGMLFIITGLGNLGWGPLGNPLVFLGFLLVLAAAWLGINRYYNDHYGRVTRSHRQQLRYTIASFLLFPAAMIGGPILDASFDLPVSAFRIVVSRSVANGCANVPAVFRMPTVASFRM